MPNPAKLDKTLYSSNIIRRLFDLLATYTLLGRCFGQRVLSDVSQSKIRSGGKSMTTESDPIIGNWYCHLDKGQRFRVVAIDENKKTVEVQNFDGNLDEHEMKNWYQLEIEPCEAPENWSGPLDIENVDDLGTDITDTETSDWNEPLDEFEPRSKGGKEE
jgi:hypothetical protein